MAQTYEVKSGDNLSSIARKLGVPLEKITGYRSGDPNLIYPGEKLTIGEATPLSGLGGSIKGKTLPSNSISPTGERELPSTSDNLSAFRGLLKSVSERYGKTSSAMGVERGMGSLGVSPEQISGRSFAGIVDYAKNQSTGISDIYQSSVDLLESSRKSAETQLSMVLEKNLLPQLSDEDIARLSSETNVDFGILTALKKTQTLEQEKPASFVNTNEGGRKIRIGFDDMGKIVSRTEIGSSEMDSSYYSNPSSKQFINETTSEELDSWGAAILLINENQDSSDISIENKIKQEITDEKGNSILSQTDIRNIIKEYKKTPLPQPSNVIADSLIAESFSTKLLQSRAKELDNAKAKAKSLVNSWLVGDTVEIEKEEVTLTRENIDEIISAIEKVSVTDQEANRIKGLSDSL